ncbi:MAG: hypothetical protein WC851_00005, partial [Candidatus Shapirobacteria bacterium]
MALEDIKSPLPPRRFSSLYDPADDKQETPPEVNMPREQDEIASATVINPEVPKSTTNSLPLAKPVDTKKMLIIGGIIALIAAIFFLVFKVIIPNLGGSKTEKVTLNYWGLWEEPSTIQAIIADYETKNPGVKINYVRNQKVNYRTRQNSN